MLVAMFIYLVVCLWFLGHCFLFCVYRLAFSALWFPWWFLISVHVTTVLISAERDSLDHNSKERELVLRRWLGW